MHFVVTSIKNNFIDSFLLKINIKMLIKSLTWGEYFKLIEVEVETIKIFPVYLLVVFLITSGFVLLEEPKKNDERKMIDLTDIQPTPALYEPLRQPDATNMPPDDAYQKLQKPIAFNPKTDIPKAIASKNASNTIEAYYVE